MRQSRLESIQQYITQHQTVSLEQLCQSFQVSKNTIRRDIDALLQNGMIQKVYGGVIAVNSNRTLTSFEARNDQLLQAKQLICNTAANFINDGDTIFVDSGTTCVHLISALNNKQVTIITHSLSIATMAIDHENITLISLPGTLNRKTLSYTGSECIEYLERYNPTKAFLACTGISLQHGISNASVEEYSIKKKILSMVQENFLLADATKFNQSAITTYAALDQITHYITDQTPPTPYESYFEQFGCKLHICQ